MYRISKIALRYTLNLCLVLKTPREPRARETADDARALGGPGAQLGPAYFFREGGPARPQAMSRKKIFIFI